MSTLRLFIVEMVRSVVLQVRYPMDFITGLVLLTFLFYGLLIGAQYITGADSFNANLNGIIVGYSTWMILYAGMNFIPTTIMGEAQRGTLEALFLSHYGVGLIFLLRAIAESFTSVIFTVVILLVLLWITDRQVSFPVGIIVPTMCTIMAAIGVGFVMGGMALEHKQIGQVLVLIQYPLLFLMMTPFEKMDAFIMKSAMFLPVVPSAVTLRELMVGDIAFGQTHYLGAVLNGVAYLLLGLLVFRNNVKRAKTEGRIAGY